MYGQHTCVHIPHHAKGKRKESGVSGESVSQRVVGGYGEYVQTEGV
jgi:hypothetical protein